MPKIQPVSREEASEEQRRIGDPIFEARGGAYRGPWGILLHNPELTERAGIYGEIARGHTRPVRFEVPGRMVYVCAYHPHMKSEVVVTARDS